MANLDEEELARLNVVLSFAMSSLFYMFLKTQGASTANHPVKKELTRIQDYIRKLKGASDNHKLAKSNEEAAAKMLATVDVEEAAMDEKITAVGDEDGGDKKSKKKKKKKSSRHGNGDDTKSPTKKSKK